MEFYFKKTVTNLELSFPPATWVLLSDKNQLTRSKSKLFWTRCCVRGNNLGNFCWSGGGKKKKVNLEKTEHILYNINSAIITGTVQPFCISFHKIVMYLCSSMKTYGNHKTDQKFIALQE